MTEAQPGGGAPSRGADDEGSAQSAASVTPAAPVMAAAAFAAAAASVAASTAGGQSLAAPAERVARRIGVMGGTFDPIHHGHLVAASEVAARFALDEVVFVPTGRPWQKTARAVSAAEHRYLMTVIATASNPRFTVSRVDLDRGGLTYTVDTLTDLKAQYPADELYFITGADALSAIMSWKDADRLLQLARLIGVTRPGYPLADPHLPGGPVTLVEVPALAISSTACRDRVQVGQPVWYLVPDGVVQYISKHHLYRSATEKGTM